jgi:D-sedoheptulose 7-phosphate isomerase
MKIPTATHELLAASIRESILVKRQILEDASVLDRIVQVGQAIANAFRAGHKLFLFGNGGSAADAQHLAAEFIGRFERERAPFPAIALTVNTSAITAISNDYAYEMVFARQVEALGTAGDVAIGISTSGRSPSVLAGLRAAKAKGMVTVGMTGSGGDVLLELTDHCIRVPSRRTARIQEAHIMIGHSFCEIVEHLAGDWHLATTSGSAPGRSN